jgi:hypothetical protein
LPAWQKLELTKYINTDRYTEEDKAVLALVRKLQEGEINKYVSRNSPFSGIWENIVHHEEDDLPEETRHLMAEYILPKLKKLFGTAMHTPVYLLPKGAAFKTAHLQKADVRQAPLQPHFSITREESGYGIECFVKPEGVAYGLADNESRSPLLFLYNHQIWIWEGAEAVAVVAPFLPGGSKKIPAAAWPDELRKNVLPWTKEYKVDFDRSLIDEIKDGEPEIKLYLQERGEYLIFQPLFNYKGFDTKAKDGDEVIIPHGDKVIGVHRNREAEQRFLDKLRALHSNFVMVDDGGALALKGAEVLKNNWFFLFVDAAERSQGAGVWF